MDFKAGNIYGLFGKNGEGKSTMLKIMAGLLFPRAGSCMLDGYETRKRNVQSLQHIFLVPEDFELPGIPIRTFEKAQSCFYPNFSTEQFYELVAEFQLSPTDVISRLSFGQKKKVLIAFGIAANTKLLLMDEPTNGLDIPSKSQFRKVMASAVDENKCIVISTHQVRDLHSLINHIIILNNGQVVFNQSLDTVSERLWFGKPAADELEDVIYSESSFGGKAILPRLDKFETEVDLELMFNGVLNEPAKINATLNQKHHDERI